MKKSFITRNVLEKAFSQLDKLGYELAKLGVTDRLNRHTAIAMAMTQKTRIEGEIERAKLHYTLAKSEIHKLTNKVDQSLDQAIDKLPEPIAKPAMRVHKKIRFQKQRC